MIYKNKEGDFINVKFPKRKGKFIIPDKILDYECYEIEVDDFKRYNELTEIIIPESVINIRSRAFFECTNLMSVKISENLISIGEYAFLECKSLTNIQIPKSVKRIGNYAFWNCQNLDIVIDNSEKNIIVGNNTFGGCKSVTWLKDKTKHSYFEYVYHRGIEPIWKVGDKLAYYEFYSDYEGEIELGTITNIELDEECDDWLYTFDNSNQDFEEDLLNSETYVDKK